jgi:N-carbamoylputrescine amidase
VLPETPFCQWFAGSNAFDPRVWVDAVRRHDEWMHRLSELAPALVLGTRPVDFGNARWNDGFIRDEEGVHSVHARFWPPDERAAREAAWFHSATAPEFIPLETHGLIIGFLIGTEVRLQDEARQYGAEDVDIIAMPRTGVAADFDAWLERARADAVVARAYALSSNRSGDFGGRGWIIAPDGRVLGLTSATQPFFTADLEIETKHRMPTPMPAPAVIDPLDTGVPP